MSYLPKDLDHLVRSRAQNRCEYCLYEQRLFPSKLEIDHIIPQIKGGKTVSENLCLSCRECNKHKADKIKAVDVTSGRQAYFFNPRRQQWKRHFKFDETFTQIIGKTACGRAMVKGLNINNEFSVTTRKLWVKYGEFPPEGY